MVGLMPVRSIDVRGIAREMTPLQRWRFRRNLVILIATENGVSQRMLADVFDLPRSTIAEIIQEFRARYGGEAHAEGRS